MSVTEIGMFKSDKPFNMKELPMMKTLSRYYTPDVVREVLVPIISKDYSTEKRKISLRALDWLVTNYAKKYPKIRRVKPRDMPERAESMYSEYKMWLRKYRRAHFDPFKRRERISFTIDGVVHKTTVGQLNFMYWASRHGVLDYAYNHIQEIERDHSEASKKKAKLNRKRRQLSDAPSNNVLILSQPITVCFKPGGRGCE